MPPRGITRRAALAGLAAIPAGWALERGFAPRMRRPDPQSLEELAQIFRQAQREAVLNRAQEAMTAGAGLDTVLGATFLAGIHDVSPRPVGSKLHCVMVIESAFQLAALTDARSAGLLTFWCLDDFKRSQELDVNEGDWTLPPRPDTAFASGAEARTEFLAGMDSWDEQRADRALVGLLPFVDHDDIFEIIWPYAARSYVNIGHKIIYAAQTDRTLQRIGWAHAEPVLRSLVHGLLYQAGGRQSEAWTRTLDLSEKEPKAGAVSDSGSTAGLLKVWRALDPAALQAAVAAALNAGADPAAAWDALRLLAAEVFLARRLSRPAYDRSALLPVHAVTVVNAFGHAARRARSPALRRQLLLQAAGWLPQLRAGFDLRADAPQVDATGRPAPDVGEFIRQLARKGVEHHQHKYAAAILDEHQAAHPRWRALLLDGALPYVPTADDPATEIAERSERLLEKLPS
jgi:hypothetical protein